VHILGLSCFYHDSASCILKDGRLVAAAQEERFSRVKHDWRFPRNAVNYCLEEAGITFDDIGLVAFHEKPFIKFERILDTFLSVAPRGLVSFLDTVPSWLKQKLWLPHILQKKCGYGGRVLFAEHHMAHAASSFFLSPFEESAVLTIDGVGEWATASYGHGRENRINLTHEMRFPHSLGLLYSAFTAYLGFKVNDAEYKVMGLAPYGKPEYYDLITDKLVDIKEDGSIRLDLKYFSFQYGKSMFNRRFEALFGVPGRIPETHLAQEHFNIAMSLQKVTEEAVLRMAGHVHRKTRSRNICLAGGVHLNSVANGRLLREGPFEHVFIQPAAGDAGGALGAACLAWHHYLHEKERHPLRDLYLGPSYGHEEARGFLVKNNISFRELNANELVKETARLISRGKVVGWFQGKMEFGPRALGNRSILADPARAGMKDIVNKKIKFRESFRPFAPSVPLDDAQRYFDIRVESPFMLLTAETRARDIPAVTHVDGSARVQTVRESDNPLFYGLLKEFGGITGNPVLLNTSLNLRGEPIACSPEDAYRCFKKSAMDCLVIGKFLVIK
jgi:carbamoyltransferase